MSTTGGKRREYYESELKDHIQIIRLSYKCFNEYYPDDTRTINQMKKVGNYCITLVVDGKKITKPLLKKVSEYIEVMRTFDRKQIQPIGRELLKLSKTIK
jgi:hypothetical protein